MSPGPHKTKLSSLFHDNKNPLYSVNKLKKKVNTKEYSPPKKSQDP